MNTDSTTSLLDTVADSSAGTDEETLIEDHREALRPAQRVDQKLVAALRTGPVLLSQMQDKVKRPNER